MEKAMSQNIGSVVKELIKDKKMTIFSLAKEIDVDRSSLQHFLSGKRKMNLEMSTKIVEKKKNYLKVLLQRARLKLYNGLSTSLKSDLKELI